MNIFLKSIIILMVFTPGIVFSKDIKSNITVSVSVVESCVIKTTEILKCTKGLKNPDIKEAEYIHKFSIQEERYKNNIFIF